MYDNYRTFLFFKTFNIMHNINYYSNKIPHEIKYKQVTREQNGAKVYRVERCI